MDIARPPMAQSLWRTLDFLTHPRSKRLGGPAFRKSATLRSSQPPQSIALSRQSAPHTVLKRKIYIFRRKF
jgi:hypothetical protein